MYFSCRQVLFILIPHVFQTPNFSSVSIYRLHNKPLPFCPETHRTMCPCRFHPLQTLCFHRIWTKNFVFRLKQPWHLKVGRFSCSLYTRHRGNTAGLRSDYHNTSHFLSVFEVLSSRSRKSLLIKLVMNTSSEYLCLSLMWSKMIHTQLNYPRYDLLSVLNISYIFIFCYSLFYVREPHK